jgi:hypothetical protein
MRKPRLLLQVATVVSSILLVAAFISYRAGAFDGLLGTSAKETTIMGGSKSKIVIEPGTSRRTPAVERDPTLMYGTKSMILVEPSEVKTAGSQAASPSQASQRSP